jgi:plastocyanin
VRRTALVVTALAVGCSSGGTAIRVTGTVTATGPVSAQQAALGMKDDLTFVPNVVQAKVGTVTLTLDNAGVIPHNLTFEKASFGQTDTVEGHSTATLKVVFTQAGTYTFRCTLHSGMNGKVVVSSAG